MENIVTISNAKDNTLEFDVDVQGIETDEMDVRFVIETGTMELGFDSEKKAKNKWSVKIPALPILDATMYPFHINIVVDGYNFTPLHGSINVVGTHEVYASKPENITLAPAKRKAKEIVKSLNKKPEEVGPTEPQEDTPPPKAPPKVKSDRKFTLEPLKVKDGKELFKTLMDKKPKPAPKKKDDVLDDKIVDLLKKAKEEKDAQPKKNVKEPKKTETNVDTQTSKQEKPKDDIVANPQDDKESVKEPEKSTVSKKIETSEEPKPTMAKKKAVSKKRPTKKKVAKKKVAKKSASNAKAVAEKIIQTVTGLGKKEPIVEKNPNDSKIKEIIKEDSKPTPVTKKAIAKEPGAIKKIGKDKKIIEVDSDKEQKIKEVLKESSDPDENKRTVTTKPIKKKPVTFH